MVIQKMKNLFFALFVISTFSGCLKDSENTFTCTYNECNQKASAAEIEQVQAYLTANNIAATQHCSGLFYVIDNAGTGVAPTVCNTVVVMYEGKLTDGTTFDKSTSPVDFPLSRVIVGFRNGLPLIKTGGKIRLFVPPSLGYGANPPQGSSIPANAILIFDVSLQQVL